MKYETIGGQVTRGETFAKMIHNLREAQECAAVLSHLSGLNNEKLNSQGWLATSEMLKKTAINVTKFAQKGFQ